MRSTIPEFHSLMARHLNDLLSHDELNVADETTRTAGAILILIAGNAPERLIYLSTLLRFVSSSSCSSEDVLMVMHNPDIQADKIALQFLVLVKGMLSSRVSRGLHALNSVERYDPVTDAWTQVHGVSSPGRGRKELVRYDIVLFVGGHDGFLALSTAEKLDVRWDVWTELAAMAFQGSNCAAALCQGSNYDAGGFDDVASVTSVERDDIEAQQWHLVPALSVPRSTAVTCISRDVPDPEYWLAKESREEGE